MHPNPSDSLLSGLLCNNDSQSDYDSCVPLLSVEVKAAVVHAVGQVEITQVYRNDKSFPIETIYFFPLDSCAAVTFFQAEFNDGTIVRVRKTKNMYWNKPKLWNSLNLLI